MNGVMEDAATECRRLALKKKTHTQSLREAPNQMFHEMNMKKKKYISAEYLAKQRMSFKRGKTVSQNCSPVPDLLLRIAISHTAERRRVHLTRPLGVAPVQDPSAA